MSVLDRPDNVPVPMGYCPCEGTPHPDGDVVFLYPELSMPGGMAAQAAISESFGAEGFDSVKFQGLIAPVWIQYGVADWTFLDDLGTPIPVNPDNVLRALPYGKGGRAVADKADDLYNEVVLAPLAERFAALSKRGPIRTPGQTSPNRATRRKRPSPSSMPPTDRVPPVA